jgi:endo-1,4-beta-xylanase
VAEALVGCSPDEPLDKTPIPDCGDVRIQVPGVAIPKDGMSLTDRNWQVPGVGRVGNTLHVREAPITIYQKAKDDRPEADVPVLPLNPDTYYHSKGDLEFNGSFKLADETSKASLLLAESLPVRFDDFEFPGKGIRVTLSKDGGHVDIWDGEHYDPKTLAFLTEQPGLNRNVKVSRSHDQLEVLVDGKTVTTLPGFTSPKTWLGLEAQGNGFAANKLTVSAPDAENEIDAQAVSMADATVAQCTDGWRNLMKTHNDRVLGTAVEVGELVDDPRYAAIVANFTGVTLGNDMKPQFLQPKEGMWTPQNALRIFDYAKRHGMVVHGHALVPNRSLPKWMREAPLDDVQRIMVDHVNGALIVLPEMLSVDVVNEALASGKAQWRNDTPWFKAMGDNFINIAFEAAQKARPNIYKIYNDNSTDKAKDLDEDRFEMILRKLRDMQQQGITNLGMGFEGHVYTTPDDNMSPADLERRMKRLAEFGFVARVSEMDVTPKDGDDTDISDEGLRTQATQFGDIARVAMQASNCIGFTMWGIGGKSASTRYIDGNGRLAGDSHGVWDVDLKQRPAAYKAIRTALLG